MKLDFCCVCGTTEDLHQHHIMPVVFSAEKRKKTKRKLDFKKSLEDCTTFEIFAFLFDQGFISEDDNTITLCSYHHNIMHGVMKFQMNNHSQMIKRGVQRAKEMGKTIGRPSSITEETKTAIKVLRDRGMGIVAISKTLNCGVGTIYKVLELKQNAQSI